MSVRIDKRKIIRNDQYLLLNDVFEYFSHRYLRAETEIYMLAGYLYSHNSDAVVKFHTDHHVPNKWITITKNTFNPEKDPNFKKYREILDNYLSFGKEFTKIYYKPADLGLTEYSLTI